MVAKKKVIELKFVNFVYFFTSVVMAAGLLNGRLCLNLHAANLCVGVEPLLEEGFFLCLTAVLTNRCNLKS